MGRFAVIFVPLFVVVALVLFRRTFPDARRAGPSTSGAARLRALASWLLASLMWTVIIYLVFLTILFLVAQADLGVALRKLRTLQPW